MSEDAGVADLLESKPDLEADLEAVLDVDEREEGWDFHDVPLDSGAFGELVSRGIVEEGDEGYRLADPDAVRRALGREQPAAGESTGDPDGASSASVPSISVSVPDVDRRAWLPLVGALAVVIALRVIALPRVFRDGAVVLSGNDPYYYRYWVETLMESTSGAVDPSVATGLPTEVRRGEPLFVSTALAAAELLGGTRASAGWVLAWYPVVAAVGCGLFVYRTVELLIDDRRVSVAAVLMLAVVPSHAFRTGLGFADHHAFDYLWFSLTLLGVVAATRLDAGDAREASRTRAFWLVAGALGVGIAGQVLSWQAGPLYLGATALYVAVLVPATLRGDRSPLSTGLPLSAGAVVGAALTLFAHVVFGWHTTLVVSSPVLLAAGVCGLVAVGAALDRRGGSARVLVGLEAATVLAVPVALGLLAPRYWRRFTREVAGLFRGDAVAETASLFGTNLEWLLLFGFLLVIILPATAWAVARGVRADDGWLAVGLFAAYFLVLAALQVRFAGALAIPGAILAGVGFLWLAAVVDATRPVALFAEGDPGPVRSIGVPERDRLVSLVGLFLLVTSLCLLQTPIKTSQVVVSESTYRTADWIDADAAERGLTYPDDYVLSQWSTNRVYNYFVNGQSRSYTFAQLNYERLLGSTNPAVWYRNTSDDVGYVVVRDDATFQEGSVYERLQAQFTNATRGTDGLGRYRIVHASADGSTFVVRFVPGGVLTGQAPPNETVTVSTTVELAHRTFTFQRTVQSTMDGRYAVRVPYPGRYTGGSADRRVRERDVTSGGFVGDPRDRARWRFEEGRGTVAFDAVGGSHGFVEGAGWASGVNGTAMEFGADDRVVLPESPSPNGSDAWSVSLWFRTNESGGVLFGNTPVQNSFGETPGVLLGLNRQGRLVSSVGAGERTARIGGPIVTDGQWHHAVLTWNGTTTRLYVDGTTAGTAPFAADVDRQPQATIGAQGFTGRIDDVRVATVNRSLADVRRLANRVR